MSLEGVLNDDGEHIVNNLQRSMEMTQDIERKMTELLDDMGFTSPEEQERIQQIVDDIRSEDDGAEDMVWFEEEFENQEALEASEDEDEILDELQALRDGEGNRFKDSAEFIGWIQEADEEQES